MSIGILPDTAFVQPSGINVASWTFVAPEHWQRKRLKFLCDVNPERSTNLRNGIPDIVSFLPMELANENRPDFQAVDRPFTEVSNGFTSFANGDVLTAKITPCFENGKGGICRSLTNGIGFGSTEFHVFRPYNEISNKYLYYVMHSRPFRETGASQMKGSAGQQRVPTDFFSEFVLPYPPRVEQDAIVGYLDAKLEQIDRFITNKRHLIELLEEDKNRVASNLIYGRHLKSGFQNVDGLSGQIKIPSSWKILRARYVLREVDERSKEGKETHLSMVQSRGLIPSEDTDSWRLHSESYAGGKVCREGDLVLNRLKAHLSVFFPAYQVGVISPDYSVYRMQNGNNPRYFELLFKTPQYNDWFRRNIRGITEGLWRLYTPDFYSLPCVVPSPEEQASLVHTYEDKVKEFNQTTSQIVKEIDLINEFRTSLIAEAVTGKIDLR